MFQSSSTYQAAAEDAASAAVEKAALASRLNFNRRLYQACLLAELKGVVNAVAAKHVSFSSASRFSGLTSNDPRVRRLEVVLRAVLANGLRRDISLMDVFCS